MDYIQYTMEVTIIVKYGISEKDAIDVTKEIIPSYFTGNVINIPSTELLTFTPKFYTSWLNQNIEMIIEKSIDPNLLMASQKIFINVNITNSNNLVKYINFVANLNKETNVNINLAKICKNDFNKNNIIIYPHGPYQQGDGGINVLYYLAKKLEETGKNVRIYPTFGIIESPHFNKYYNNDFDITDCVVVYCEGTVGNPLCARYSVRWMLSELGKNVPHHYMNTWNQKELVYYFNTENRIESSPKLQGTVYKQLPLLIIPSIFKNTNSGRVKNSCCFSIRKGNHMRKTITIMHAPNSFEITRHHNHADLFDFFNKFEFFVSYDPITFLNIMAVLCGCISIVAPMPNMSKDEWLKTTAGYGYLSSRKINGYYGIAYGHEEIEWAKSTIHLAKQQWDDIISYNHKFYESFVEDLNHLEDGTLQNTIENNYLK
jgi:hypothetical protein